MLLRIREKVRSSKPLKYTLIGVITIPFAIAGIGSYFYGSGTTDVAEVNGVAINNQELERAYDLQRQRIAQMFGGNIPAGIMTDESIRGQALESLVTNQVVRSVVTDQKFAVGDVTLGKAIRSNPEFQIDGKFDPEVYQNTLQSNRLNVATYEAGLRDETAINQFRAGVFQTAFQLPSEAEKISQLSKQTRTVDYVRYSIDKAIEAIEVSDEDATTYFNENAESFKFPERAKLQYIELKKSDIAAEIEIEDEDAEKYYEEFKGRYVIPETRDASHILLGIDDIDDEDEVAEKTKQLEDVKARIVAGESFADLAKEFSTDIGSAENGGSLGQISPGAMVPEFEQAVYGLAAVDDLSDVVKSQYGVHLIKLDRLVPEAGKPFEEVKDEIVTDLQNDAADLEFLELKTAMEENAASDPESLEMAADASNVEIKESDWVDVDLQGDLVFSHPQVLNAAFSDELLVEQNNSDIIEISPDHVVVVRVLEHEDPRPKTLEDVKDDVAATLKRERAETQLDELLAAAKELIIKGTPVATVAKDSEYAEAVSDELLTRQSVVFDNTVVAEIYALAKPAEGKTLVKSTTLQNGDRLAYALKAVAFEDKGEDTESSVETPAAPISNPQLGQSELAAFVGSLRARADVDIFE